MRLGNCYNYFQNTNLPTRIQSQKTSESSEESSGATKDAKSSDEQVEVKYKKGAVIEADTLFVLGFSKSQIAQYFEKAEGIRTLGGRNVDGYYLKEGIVIDGKEITNCRDLADALGVTHGSNKNESITLDDYLKRMR